MSISLTKELQVMAVQNVGWHMQLDFLSLVVATVNTVKSGLPGASTLKGGQCTTQQGQLATLVLVKSSRHRRAALTSRIAAGGLCL
jgi:hypothetical protein